MISVGLGQQGGGGVDVHGGTWAFVLWSGEGSGSN